MKHINLSILIVEDEIFGVKYLSGILKKLGIETLFEANNANKALEIANNKHIDIAFMDININGSIDGIKCANLLNDKYFIPIIYTTAYADSNTIKEASDSNLFSYLVKPFEPHDVEAALQVTLKLMQTNKIGNTQNDKDDEIINLGNEQVYNLKTKIFSIKNKSITLTKKEMELIEFFCNNVNQSISYEILKENVWNNLEISNSTIRDTISRLKKKAPNILLENIINFGYILKLSI